MSFKLKFLLGVFIFSGLLGIYFADESFTAKKEQRKQENAVALYFKNDDCIKFSMQNGNSLFVFERKDNKSPWYMISPKSVMADQEAVSGVLVLLQNISIQKVVDLKPEDQFENFGLVSPSLHFEVTLKNHTTKTLSVGNSLNNNVESAFHMPSVYAKSSGHTNLLIVDDSSLPSFYDKKYEDFRTKQITNFKYADVSTIVIKTKTNTVELVRHNNNNHHADETENKWVITSPQSVVADQNFIAEYIQMFPELMADEVLESPINAQALLTKENIVLNNPSASIIFKDDTQKSVQELSLYMSKNGLFITLADGSLAKIELDKWSELVPAFKKLRNREVLLGANVKCNSELDTLVADDIFDNVSDNDLQKFGLEKPFKIVGCSKSTENKDQKNNKGAKDSKELNILIGNRVPLDEKNVYIKRSDSKNVYIVSAESLSKLAQ